MLLKFWFISLVGLIIHINQPCVAGQETCETKQCGPLEMCTTCAMTPCNTYSCENFDGTKIACKFPCVETPPTCICKPKYHRVTPGAPCTRIKCRTTAPVKPTCKTIKCGRNQICAPCGQNACNTYNCGNLDGSLVDCRTDCTNKKPACICKPKYHRLSVNGPCVPIICSKH